MKNGDWHICRQPQCVCEREGQGKTSFCLGDVTQGLVYIYTVCGHFQCKIARLVMTTSRR